MVNRLGHVLYPLLSSSSLFPSLLVVAMLLSLPPPFGIPHLLNSFTHAIYIELYGEFCSGNFILNSPFVAARINYSG
jgi:hypothetical protein